MVVDKILTISKPSQFPSLDRFLVTADAYFPGCRLQDAPPDTNKTKSRKSKRSRTTEPQTSSTVEVGTSPDPGQSEETQTEWIQTQDVCEGTHLTVDCQIQTDMVEVCDQMIGDHIETVDTGQMCDTVQTVDKNLQYDLPVSDASQQTAKAKCTTIEVQTDSSHGVRLQSIQVDNRFPETWTMGLNYKAKPYYLLEIHSGSDEYQMMRQLFCKSMRMQLKTFKLERVQNGELWEGFMWRWTQMTKQRNDGAVVQRWLFHGTKIDNIPNICRQGFDMRLNGQNGTLFGKGTYFARDASYSDGYTNKNFLLLKRPKCMFIARVLLGDFCIGNKDLVRPPWNGKTDRFYDSCVDHMADPTKFVIFNNDQMYPEYVVTYMC